MEYEQERYARHLHGSLAARLSAGDAELGVSGAGVHWHCTVRRGHRNCTVNCFDLRGPQYLVSLEVADLGQSRGRTRSESEALDVVVGWLDGRSVSRLHEQFEFLDRDRRQLSSLLAVALERHPRLAEVASPDLRHDFFDQYGLHFKNGDRTSETYFYGENLCPDSVLSWDECSVARFQTCDWQMTADVLNRWLVERALPSQLQAELPAVRTHPVARYYEEGRPVEGEFITSWDAIEQFYRTIGHAQGSQILDFIARMRSAGYDRSLRAGQSLFTLMLSRSRRHGLRRDQPFIAFTFHDRGMKIDTHLLGRKRIACPRIELTGEVEAVLNELAMRDID